MLSIIVTWRDRCELERTIDSLVCSIVPLGGEIIVVNYSGDAQLLQSQIEGRSNTRVITVMGEQYFNKSAAQNMGVSVARNDVLFFCDCDIIVDEECIALLTNSVAAEKGLFCTVAGVTETEINAREARHVTRFGYTLNICTADGRELTIVDNEEDGDDGTRQAPGLLFVRKANLLAIGGYNSALEGWGWEDQDIISRLTLGLGLKRLQYGQFSHVSHDDRARMAHYPDFASRWESRDRMFRKALSNYDDGNFIGSYRQDVARLVAIAADCPE